MRRNEDSMKVRITNIKKSKRHLKEKFQQLKNEKQNSS